MSAELEAVRTLEEFRALLDEWAALYRGSHLPVAFRASGGPVLNRETLAPLRSKLNQRLPHVEELVRAKIVNTKVVYYGHAYNPFDCIFQEIADKMIPIARDLLDRAIGAYKAAHEANQRELSVEEAQRVLFQLSSLHERYKPQLAKTGFFGETIEPSIVAELNARWIPLRTRLRNVPDFSILPEREPPKPVMINDTGIGWMRRPDVEAILADIEWATKLLQHFINARSVPEEDKPMPPKKKIRATKSVSSGRAALKPVEEQPTSKIRLFISHAWDDRALAGKFCEWLEGSLEIPAGTMRCTSVAPYKLNTGDPGGDILRADLTASKVILALVTEDSLASAYVTMELGAGWALKKRVGCLLLPHVSFSQIKGPIAGNHGTYLNDSNDLTSLIDLIEQDVGYKAKTAPARSVAMTKFVEYVKALPTPKKDEESSKPKESKPAAAEPKPAPAAASPKKKKLVTDPREAALLVRAWSENRLTDVTTIRLSQLDDILGLKPGLAAKVISPSLEPAHRVTIAGDHARLERTI